MRNVYYWRIVNAILLFFLFTGTMKFDQNVENQEKPNIIFILADDLGVSDVNSFDDLGRTYYETPNIDQLGREGMRFMQAYTNAANCAPTRAAMISGQYFPNQPIYHVGRPGAGRRDSDEMISAENADELPLDKITDAEMLKKAGYRTALIGKWHIGKSPEYGPQQQGYDINIGGTGAGNPRNWEGGYFQPNNNPEISDAEEDEYLTDYLTRKAVEFISENRDGPFYLNMAYYTPHLPLQAPDSLVQKYEQKNPDRGHDNPTYAAMIESLDTNVGKIVDAVDDVGIAENTLIIFYSDNGGLGGYEFLGIEGVNVYTQGVTDNSPLKGGKTTYYEGGIRSPAIARWPGMIEQGTTSDEPVIGIDFYPTYLELVGLDKPENYELDGVSIVPLFRNPDADLNRKSMFWHFPGYPNSRWRTGPISVVRSGSWKLMKFYATDHWELYNLREDPYEQNNLVEQMPDQTEEMKRKLENWLAETGAPFPSWPNEDQNQK